MARGGQTIAPQPWMWLAREARRRQGMAVHGGARRRRRAQRLWAQRPQAYRPPATCSPAPSGGYASVLLAAQPRTIRTWARQTPPSERCHNPRRQRVARWGREALAGSNNRAQPIGAITLFLCHDNLTSATAEIEPYMDSTTPARDHPSDDGAGTPQRWPADAAQAPAPACSLLSDLWRPDACRHACVALTQGLCRYRLSGMMVP